MHESTPSSTCREHPVLCQRAARACVSGGSHCDADVLWRQPTRLAINTRHTQAMRHNKLATEAENKLATVEQRGAHGLDAIGLERHFEFAVCFGRGGEHLLHYVGGVVHPLFGTLLHSHHQLVASIQGVDHQQWCQSAIYTRGYWRPPPPPLLTSLHVFVCGCARAHIGVHTLI